MSEQMDQLKLALSALGLHVSVDHHTACDDVIVMSEEDEEITFRFDRDGKFEYLFVWKV